MKTAHAIFGAAVASFGVAAFVTIHEEFKAGTQTPPHPHVAAQKADPLTPANSIARDFAVLSTPASSIAQELADAPKSVQTVPIGRGSTLQPALPAPTQAVAPTPAPTARGSVADHQVAPETLLSHAEPADVCARYGGHRVDFMRGHHAMWKCVYQTRKQRASKNRRRTGRRRAPSQQSLIAAAI